MNSRHYYGIVAKERLLTQISDDLMKEYICQNFIFKSDEPDWLLTQQEVDKYIKIQFLIEFLDEEGELFYSLLDSSIRISLDVFDDNFTLIKLVTVVCSDEVHRFCQTSVVNNLELTGHKVVDNMILNQFSDEKIEKNRKRIQRKRRRSGF